MEMETADPDAAMKEMDIENDGASGSWKAMEIGLETEMESACWMEMETESGS